MKIIILSLFAYIIGSIPSAYIITKIFKGTDIRKIGSGNPGTTNVIRTTGILPGIITFLFDFGKGIFTIWFTKQYWNSELIPLVMFFTIVGHVYTVFLSFSGGKGVATFFGSLVMISPKVCLIVASIFIIVCLITHIVSLSSLIAIIMFCILIFVHPELNQYVYTKIFFLFSVVLIIYRHKSNIIRILTKQEKKLW